MIRGVLLGGMCQNRSCYQWTRANYVLIGINIWGNWGGGVATSMRKVPCGEPVIWIVDLSYQYVIHTCVCVCVRMRMRMAVLCVCVSIQCICSRCVRVCVCLCLSACTRTPCTCTCTCTCIYVFVYVYAHLFVCMCLCPRVPFCKNAEVQTCIHAQGLFMVSCEAFHLEPERSLSLPCPEVTTRPRRRAN